VSRKRKARPPLTKAKQAQGAAVHKGKPLHYSAAVEMRYTDTLTRMVRQMRQATESAFRRLDRQFATAQDALGMDAPSYASQARILTDALRKRFAAAFARRARPAAERMQAQVDAASSASLHSSLRELSGGISLSTRSIPKPAIEMLKASVTENVALIRSIPDQYFLDVQGAVMRNIQRGDGTAGVLREIERAGGVATRRAELIARDQVSKATSALNAARMKGLGIRKFEWIHSGGGKEPRKLHQRMSGNIYSLDDPPVIDERTGERGLPGQLINCRCVMRPVLEFEE
jgi:SPP1 gp7 family putative phage head morphogenesis protein